MEGKSSYATHLRKSSVDRLWRSELQTEFILNVGCLVFCHSHCVFRPILDESLTRPRRQDQRIARQSDGYQHCSQWNKRDPSESLFTGTFRPRCKWSQGEFLLVHLACPQCEQHYTILVIRTHEAKFLVLDLRCIARCHESKLYCYAQSLSSSTTS